MNCKIGIIGCGYWGQNYVRIFRDILNNENVKVCDTNKDKLKKMLHHYPHVDIFTDYNELLKNKEISGVVVSTPTINHYSITKQALINGKHVLVEKPLTTDVTFAEELIRLAKSKKKILMVGHTFIYNSAVKKMKEYISKGKIGRIYYLHATRTHLGLIRKDVNVIWDLVPHDVSIFSYLLGKNPLWVSAVGGQFLHKGKEDIGFITLAYPSGILGNIHVSWIDSNKVREVVIVGSKKRIIFDDINNLEKLRVYEKGVSVEKPIDGFGEWQYLLRDGDIISPKIEMSEPLRVQCQHFIDCIKNSKNCITDGSSGLNVVKTIVAIEKSIRNNGKAVKI